MAPEAIVDNKLSAMVWFGEFEEVDSLWKKPSSCQKEFHIVQGPCQTNKTEAHTDERS